jgi:hypothetical protein
MAATVSMSAAARTLAMMICMGAIRWRAMILPDGGRSNRALGTSLERVKTAGGLDRLAGAYIRRQVGVREFD